MEHLQSIFFILRSCRACQLRICILSVTLLMLCCLLYTQRAAPLWIFSKLIYFLMYKNPIQYISFGPTSVWYTRSLTVLGFILRFPRMNNRDLFNLDDVCCMYLFHFRPEDIVIPKCH